MLINPTPQALKEAAAGLLGGGLVAFPTETVYGLGANALDDRAVAAIYQAKGRPQFNPLIVHLGDPGWVSEYAAMTPVAAALMAAFWPGALTLVLKRNLNCPISLLASAGLDTVALRMPAHETALALLRQAGIPIAAPSANRSGRVSPTAAGHVEEEFDGKIPVLDGGPCWLGIESTVVDLSGGQPILLRPGSITREQLEAVAGKMASADAATPLHAPGMLKSHYAPSLPVRLDATGVLPGEALLAFGDSTPACAEAVLNLSEAGDLAEAAANLFACLRSLDREPYRGIAVMPVPHTGLGIAINDRLQRAAADRA